MPATDVPKWVVYLFMGLMLVIGAANAFFMKGQDEIRSRGQYFIHPFLQCTFMFLGEFMCLFAFFLIVKIQKLRGTYKEVKSEKPELNPFYYGIPALCDTIVTKCLPII